MKCSNCNEEWTPACYELFIKCPFCQTNLFQLYNQQIELNSAKLILKIILKENGHEILHNEQNLIELISNRFVNNIKMQSLLLLSIREHVPILLTAIQSNKTTHTSIEIRIIQKKLVEEAFLNEDIVEQILFLWMHAIGLAKFADENAVTDIDGNTYITVRIGNQIWMAENLKVNRYRNGNLIPNVTENEEWRNLKTGAWCNYENNQGYDMQYGKLYNWFAVGDKRGLAPEGWHIPSDEEWTILTDELGGDEIAGRKLKEISSLWNSPNWKSNNESGFSALPSGCLDEMFRCIGSNGGWWSATPNDTSCAWERDMGYNISDIYRNDLNMQNGLSVRCVKD